MDQIYGNGKGPGQARHAHRAADARVALRNRVDSARDMLENMRDQAEVAFRDRPYLVPVAACAVGVGFGLLMGSRIMRLLVLTTVGAVLSDMFGGEIRRFGRDFVDDLQGRLSQGSQGNDPSRPPSI
ncbi:MAG: hypothetical protein FWD73_05200 [Polyangiaceae bacterium]|nr:hypothetical protein [Polyangiaceae bacterium]